MRNVALILMALAAGCSFSTDFDRSYSDTFEPSQPDPLQPWFDNQEDSTQAEGCLALCEDLASCFEDTEGCRSNDSLSISTCAQACYISESDVSIGTNLCEATGAPEVQDTFCNEPMQSDVACDAICQVLSSNGCKASLTANGRAAPQAAEAIAMQCRAACNDNSFRCCISAEYQRLISSTDNGLDESINLCVRGQACVLDIFEPVINLPDILPSLDLPPASCGDDIVVDE